jgi:predicted metal-binding membrane protein
MYLVKGPMPGATSGGAMSGMAGMDMSADAFASWGMREAFLLFAMWAVMMVAMMLPSATPMILLFARVRAARLAKGQPGTPTFFFTGGYLAVWGAFSAVAALMQWTLHSLAVLSPGMRTVSPFVTGAILIGAGVYQWMPLKQSCLSHCQSPLGFLTTSWKEGKRGAISMGIKHGAFCLGCCWALMALLFAGGVMNLAVVAAISIAVLIEKVVPAGQMIARIYGVLLITAGILSMARFLVS